jgi:membrane protein implicated in regulation of membrane protease activity
MTIVYLSAFILGLLVGIRIMLYGVERPREQNPSGERSFSGAPAILCAFAIIFGALGYSLTRQGVGTEIMRALIAAGSGMVAAITTARLVSRWWKVTPEHDVDDERYVLQGHVGRVTKPIRADVDGEVMFEIGTEARMMRARSFDESAMSTGTEVVIERVEGDVAYVEAWRDVEKRL